MNATSERLRRQVACIGEDKQALLSRASVMIVGVGGIGSITAMQLAKMGCGEITLIDRAVVKLNNLSRQMYREYDVNQPKATVTRERLKKINPEIKVNAIYANFEACSCSTLIDTTHTQLILDCTDNAEARWEIEKLALQRKLPWVYAAVVGYTGRVKPMLVTSKVRLETIVPKPSSNGNGFNYDTMPKPQEIGTVLPTVEIVSSIQVIEALKIIWGETELTDYMYNICSYPVVKTERMEMSA